MKILPKHLLQACFIFILIFLLFSCSSSNKLKLYQFNNSTASASEPLAPPATVFTHSSLWIDEQDPLGSLVRIGTTIAKEVEAVKVRAKLDSALELVDIPMQIKEKTLIQCSRFMRYQPVENTADSDFLFTFHIKKYGIEAKNWSATAFFNLKVQVDLLDNKNEKRIWKKKVTVNQPITSRIFGIGESLGNVFTAVALSRLTVDQIANGLENLADFAADEISRKLRDDYMKSRE